MIYILKDRIIRIEWTILKGTSHVREDFRRANVKVFLIGNTEKYYLEATAEDGILKFDIPQGLEEGTYGIEAIWVKNEGHLGMGNRSISRSKKERLFSITEFEEEATNLGDGEVVLKFTSSTATYGYDGLSSYELAVLRGEWTGTEGEWLKHQRYVSVLDGRGDSETDTMSQKSITEELEAHDKAIEANKKAIEENKKEFDKYTDETDDRLDDVEERLDYIPKESFLSSDPAAGFNTSDVIEEDCVADRAIADRFGRRIDEEYVTRESVKNYTQEVVDGSKLEIMPGSVVPESLSPAVKQMIEAGAGKPGSITNLPDEEDITVTDANTLQFKDKEYNPYNYSGMGRVYLRKHIVNGTNILTQHMINKPNTIYIIQYDYCLADQTIEIPENCVLQFDGGSFRNGSLYLQNTFINSTFSEKGIFSNIEFDGKVTNNNIIPEWFYFGEDDFSLSINEAILKSSKTLVNSVKLKSKEYSIYNTIYLKSNVSLIGEGGQFSTKIKVNCDLGILYEGESKDNPIKYSDLKNILLYTNDGINENRTKTAISYIHANSCNMSDIYIENFNCAINCNDLVASYNRRITIRKFNSYGIKLFNTVNFAINESTITGSRISEKDFYGNYAIFIDYLCDGIEFLSTNIYNCKNCIWIDNTVSNYSGPTSVFFTSVQTGAQCSGYGAYISKNGLVSFTDCLFNQGLKGIYAVNAGLIHINNCQMNGNESSGIHMINCQRSYIKNSIFSKNNISGIIIDRGTDISIEGCTFGSSSYLSTRDSENQQYGIVFWGSNINIKCRNNNFLYLLKDKYSYGSVTKDEYTSDIIELDKDAVPEKGIYYYGTIINNKSPKLMGYIGWVCLKEGHYIDVRPWEPKNYKTYYENEYSYCTNDGNLYRCVNGGTGNAITPPTGTSKEYISDGSNTWIYVCKDQQPSFVPFGKITYEESTLEIPENTTDMTNTGYSIYDKSKGRPFWLDSSLKMRDSNGFLPASIKGTIENIPSNSEILNDYGRTYFVYEYDGIGYPLFFSSKNTWINPDTTPYNTNKIGSSEDRFYGISKKADRCFFDTTLGKPIFYNGEKWVDSEGNDADYKKTAKSNERPEYPKIGFNFYDTTINKPIWWTGEKWVDATGAEV